MLNEVAIYQIFIINTDFDCSCHPQRQTIQMPLIMFAPNEGEVCSKAADHLSFMFI